MIGLGGAAQEGGDRGAAGAGARGERLPHPALEDPRPHPAAVDREEGDVGAVREQLVAFDLGPDLAEVEVVELVADDDRALRVADRDVLELPLAAGRARACRVPSSPPEGKSFEVVEARPMSTEQVSSPVIVGVIGPATVVIANVVLVGPAVAAQVEDRLAGAVAGELGLGAVGVEDPQLGDELRVLAAREQQDAVGADPEVRVAEPLDPLRVQLPGQVRPPRGSGSRCPAPATSRISSARSLFARAIGRDARGHARRVGVRLGAVDRGQVRDLAHPGELAAGVVAASASSSPRRRRRAARRSRAPCGRCGRGRAASARRASSAAPAATIASAPARRSARRARAAVHVEAEDPCVGCAGRRGDQQLRSPSAIRRGDLDAARGSASAARR